MNIEELIERYFAADTTVSEERQLREYFAREDVPAHLLGYRAMFGVLADVQPVETAGSSAEDCAVKTQGSRVVKFSQYSKRVYRVLRPLLRATACVACVLTVVMATEQGMSGDKAPSILTPTNSQSVGVEVSEWAGLQPIDCPPDTIGFDIEP